MDGGMFLEKVLKQLVETGDPNRINLSASDLQRAIGDEACKKLSVAIKEILDENRTS